MKPDNHTLKRTYRWPWFALAAVLLFIALMILWVAIAAKKVEQQRDFTPLPSSAVGAKSTAVRLSSPLRPAGILSGPARRVQSNSFQRLSRWTSLASGASRSVSTS